MKLRLSHFLVQPVLVIDDGEELSPGPGLETQQLSKSQLLQLIEDFDNQLSELQKELDSKVSNS